MQFYNGEKWLSQWDTNDNQIPAAVRLEVTLYSDQIQSAKFRTVTSILTRCGTQEKETIQTK